jgi:hypothetical protein
MRTRVLSRNNPTSYISKIAYKPVFTNRFVYRRKTIASPSNKVVTKVSIADVEYVSYLIGKSIILFTMFYCSLNWWHYHQINKEIADIEKSDEKKNNKKDNKNE